MSASINFTDQQSAAIQTDDVSIALSAGAGCGKTFVLTQRFLKHLEPDCGADQLYRLVAITFTERAAREMRERIRTACLARLHSCSESDETHWQQIVRGMDSARITTIHSFCGSLLRAHAVDAKLDPQFGVLEPAVANALLRRIVKIGVRDLIVENEPDCEQLLVLFGLERLENILHSLVPQRYRIEWCDFQNRQPDELANEWLQRWPKEFVPAILHDFVESDEIRNLLATLSEHKPANNVMRERCDLILAQLPKLNGQELPSSDQHLSSGWKATLRAIRENAYIKGGGGKNAWAEKEIFEQVKRHFSKLRERLDRLEKQLSVDETDTRLAAEIGLAAVRLTEKFVRQYEAEKRNQGLLDFDDLLILSRDLLRSSPSALARAASGIRFLMVDEFQDTDPTQAEIVRLLCGNQLMTGKLFMVGDVKQSIYRFRRADPTVFQRMRQEFPESGRLPLSTNFRSQPEILNFANCLFAPAMGDDYEPLRPFIDQQISPKPAIEFMFPSIGPEVDHATVDDRRRIEADWIARRIAALLADEVPRIRSGDLNGGIPELCPTGPGDIVILFRTLSNIAIYEEALRKYQLEYYLVGGRAFYAQQEIFDLINLCQFLDDPDDEVSLVGVLRSGFFNLADDSLFAMSRRSRRLVAALLDDVPSQLPPEQRQQVRHAQDVLRELRSKKDRLPLAELLQLAFDRTGYDAALLNEFLGRRKLANLKKLIEMARQCDQAGLFTLKDFVIRMRESIVEQADEELAATHPESSNVVRLMTVHQSKGLEFPVVIVADMDWSPPPNRSSAQLHPEFGAILPIPDDFGRRRENLAHKMFSVAEQVHEKAEVDRLLYVATTRAADYLILSACFPSNRIPTSPWLKLVRSSFDLDSGLPHVDPYLGSLSTGTTADAIPDILVHRQASTVSLEQHTKTESVLPLAEFHNSIEMADPVPPPSSYGPIDSMALSRRHFSVSEIENTAAQLENRVRASRPSMKPSSASSSEQLGTLVHAVLEKLDFQHPAKIEELLDRCVKMMTETITAKTRKSALNRLQAFAASDVCAELGRARSCYRELEFLLRRPMNGNPQEYAQVAGTIDCFVQQTDERWTIIDYKTGRHASSESDSSIIAEFEIQLGIYVAAVERFLHKLPTEVELVLLQDEVRRIRVTIDEDRLQELLQRADKAIHHLCDCSSDSDIEDTQTPLFVEHPSLDAPTERPAGPRQQLTFDW